MKKNNDRMRELVSILMESALYFDFSLEERRQVIAGLLDRMESLTLSLLPSDI